MLFSDIFSKGDIVAVGLSGGKDSICLLHILIENANKLGITVRAVNVEHGIRGASSIADSEFVKSHCRAFNVPCKCFSVDVPTYAETNGMGEEEAARKLRYDCFYSAINSGFCNKIATAHHAGDNAETLLMNLFRGSSLAGVCGIKPISDDGKIIRPILDMTREEIDNYILTHNLPFVHDSTNDDETYTRNFIRNKIMPLILTKFGGAERAINRFAETARTENELLDRLSENYICDNAVIFTDEEYKPLFFRACLKILKEYGIEKDFEKCHLEAIYKLKDNITGARITLKKGVVAYKSYDRVVFLKTQNFSKNSDNIGGTDDNGVSGNCGKNGVNGVSSNGGKNSVSGENSNGGKNSVSGESNLIQDLVKEFKLGEIDFGDYVIISERVNADGENILKSGFENFSITDYERTKSTEKILKVGVADDLNKSGEKRLNDSLINDNKVALLKNNLAVKSDYVKAEKILYFDMDKLPYKSIIRTKRSGDEILSFGGKTKSLKKFFTEKKVPARVSEFMPVIASENRVFAVLNVDISADIKIDKTSKNIIKITCKSKRI